MCFCISRSVENSPEMVSNEAAMFTLLSHANLADISGDTDFDFERFFFLEFVDPTFPEFHAPGFQNWRIIIVPTETGGVY